MKFYKSYILACTALALSGNILLPETAIAQQRAQQRMLPSVEVHLDVLNTLHAAPYAYAPPPQAPAAPPKAAPAPTPAPNLVWQQGLPPVQQHPAPPPPLKIAPPTASVIPAPVPVAPPPAAAMPTYTAPAQRTIARPSGTALPEPPQPAPVKDPWQTTLPLAEERKLTEKLATPATPTPLAQQERVAAPAQKLPWQSPAPQAGDKGTIPAPSLQIPNPEERRRPAEQFATATPPAAPEQALVAPVRPSFPAPAEKPERDLVEHLSKAPAKPEVKPLPKKAEEKAEAPAPKPEPATKEAVKPLPKKEPVKKPEPPKAEAKPKAPAEDALVIKEPELKLPEELPPAPKAEAKDTIITPAISKNEKRPDEAELLDLFAGNKDALVKPEPEKAPELPILPPLEESVTPPAKEETPKEEAKEKLPELPPLEPPIEVPVAEIPPVKPAKEDLPLPPPPPPAPAQPEKKAEEKKSSSFLPSLSSLFGGDDDKKETESALPVAPPPPPSLEAAKKETPPAAPLPPELPAPKETGKEKADILVPIPPVPAPPAPPPVAASKGAEELPPLPGLADVFAGKEAATAPAEQEIAAVRPPAAPPPPPAPEPDVSELPGGPELRITFSSTETEVPLSEEARLEALMAKLKAAPGKRVLIKSYAGGDEEQSTAAKRVSLSRAISVRTLLIDKGLDISRIEPPKALGNKVETGPADRVDIFLVD